VKTAFSGENWNSLYDERRETEIYKQSFCEVLEKTTSMHLSLQRAADVAEVVELLDNEQKRGFLTSWTRN
jgi:hypothetical protein